MIKKEISPGSNIKIVLLVINTFDKINKKKHISLRSEIKRDKNNL